MICFLTCFTINYKGFSILAALQSGAKDKGAEPPLNGRENKGPHSGPKYGVIHGGFPLFTTHLRAKIGGLRPLKRKNGTHGMLPFILAPYFKGAEPPLDPQRKFWPRMLSFFGPILTLRFKLRGHRPLRPRFKGGALSGSP